MGLRSWSHRRHGADYAARPALSAPPAPKRQPTASSPRADAQRTSEIDETLVELSQQYGVSDEQLALLTGWSAAEIVDRRAHGLALAHERAPELELAGPPVAPVAEPPGKADIFARALSGAYLLGLLAAVLYYKSAFFQMITVSPFLATYGLIALETLLLQLSTSGEWIKTRAPVPTLLLDLDH